MPINYLLSQYGRPPQVVIVTVGPNQQFSMSPMPDIWAVGELLQASNSAEFE